MLRLLGDHGLSSREGCSNTVRNVTGDPWAGIRADEPFDVTPYAAAFVRYWVRNPISQALPRKFKVTFSASEADAAMTSIHDQPRERQSAAAVDESRLATVREELRRRACSAQTPRSGRRRPTRHANC